LDIKKVLLYLAKDLKTKRKLKTNKMRNTIKEELKNYLDNFIKDLRSDIDEIYDGQELHHKAFNEDHYIIGYYQAEQWLKKHDVSVFEAINFVQDYEREMFGADAVRSYDNAESLVNMLVYIVGEEITMQLDF